ncbi:MAG: hypothetical protein A3E84_02775 [Gammaproteobacteria bacterium RIFCSPHIGHO2_12_FULL_42_13]|nr:MAG: hypothetical protein A3E84_02775 [Gammaproteobacteria bacterium RIFCSPHIGHO2_12_FULL_42_13]
MRKKTRIGLGRGDGEQEGEKLKDLSAAQQNAMSQQQKSKEAIEALNAPWGQQQEVVLQKLKEALGDETLAKTIVRELIRADKGENFFAAKEKETADEYLLRFLDAFTIDPRLLSEIANKYISRSYATDTYVPVALKLIEISPTNSPNFPCSPTK